MCQLASPVGLLHAAVLSCSPCAAAYQGVPHLPLPLLKMCDFGYSKEEARSAAKSKVRHDGPAASKGQQLVITQVMREQGITACFCYKVAQR